MIRLTELSVTTASHDVKKLTNELKMFFFFRIQELGPDGGCYTTDFGTVIRTLGFLSMLRRLQ
jgi:hypothetical protein